MSNVWNYDFFQSLQCNMRVLVLGKKMKVKIAAQTLSRTVGLELMRKGKEGLSNFVLLVNRWFDLVNTSIYHSQRRANEDLLPYRSKDQKSEERLHWLRYSFMDYLLSWKRNVTLRKLPEGCWKNDRSSMLLSKVTENGLLMSTCSIINVVNDCLREGAEYVCTRRLNQDPLESHFGHQRQRGRYCDAPTALAFAYNVRAIDTFRSPVIGSNVENMQGPSGNW